MTTERAACTALLLTLALFGGACGDDDGATGDAGPAVDAGPADAGEPPFTVDSYCPGAEGCPAGGDPTLLVGAAMREITPSLEGRDRMTLDTNGDGIWDPFDGDEFKDVDEDGLFDPVFIAGFGSPRPASDIHDPQWARAIVLQQGETTMALVALDTFSIFIDDTDAIRAMVGDEVDFLTTCATHTHQGADTLGIYGLGESSSGAELSYLQHVREQAAAAVREALEELRPAHVQYASFRFRDQPGGTTRYVSDARHPRIIDDEARIARFLDAEDESTIATFVNFGAHAEYWGDENTNLSSDFPHFLRDATENGVAGPDGEEVPGVGGMTAFCQGAIGSQIGPGEITPETWEGEALPDESRETMEVVGRQMGYFVLQALGEDGGSVTDETAELGFRQRRFFVDVQNRGFHVAILNDLFLRESYGWDEDQLLRPGVNEPDILTEVAVVDIGRLQMIWVPGEIDPALFVGGYDGTSYTPEDVDFIDDDLENPPDIALAPEGPYLRDLAREDAEYVGIVSLGSDQIGYFLPDFDYVLDARNPYIDEAPGDHYEETVSVGIDGWGRVQRQLEQLLAWTPDE